MKVLLVAAVADEIPGPAGTPDADRWLPLVTGPGIPATVYRLTRHLRSGRPDLIVNAGLAGSFSDRLPPGAVARVVSDTFADLGAEDGETFIHISGLPFHRKAPVYSLRMEAPPLPFASAAAEGLPTASAITVSTVHGRDESIRRATDAFHPDLESMEGAAVFFVAQQEGIPVLQVRAVSNRVERRDTERWKTQEAVAALGAVLQQLRRELA